MVNTMPSAASVRSDHAFSASPSSRASVSPRLSVDFVDVRRAMVYPVRIWADGQLLQVSGRGLMRQVPMARIDWRHAQQTGPQRMARLPDGCALCASQAQEWDTWCQQVLTAPHTPLPHAPWPRLWASVAAGAALVMLLVWAVP